MNRWECEFAMCKTYAVGVGGAFGLRAIGWHFEPGGQLLCPMHRPDPIQCLEQPEEEGGSACTCCTGEVEAGMWQDHMRLMTDSELQSALQNQRNHRWIVHAGTRDITRRELAAERAKAV